MKRISALAILVVLLAGCRQSGVSAFWDGVDINVSADNYSEAEERFADFAELAVASPTEEALKGLDALFDKLRGNEVSYYIYEEWIEGSFYTILSPCRNAALFDAAAARMQSDGVLTDMEDRIASLRHWNSLNLEGARCSLPPLTGADGSPVEVPDGQPCTILLVDVSCRSCTAALGGLSGGEGRHIAVCFGGNRAPDAPGWEYCFSRSVREWFDPESAPMYFRVAADGTVTQPYTPAEGQGFAEPY